MHRIAKMLMLSFLAAAAVTNVAAAAQPPDPAAFQGRVQPFFEKYCYSCHGMDRQKAGLGLHNFNSPADVLKHRKTFDEVFEMLVHSDMPPEDELQPTPEERNFVADWVKAQLNSLDCTKGPTDPGRVTIRRLNRVEYSNTIQDLLGVRYEVGNEFPADDVGYGFDNIGDVLSMPPVLLERYLAAAQQISEMAIQAHPRKPEITVTNLDLSKAPEHKSIKHTGDGLAFYSNGETSFEFNASDENSYQLIIEAYGTQAGNEPVKAMVKVDGRPVKKLVIADDKPHAFPVQPLRWRPGTHKITIEFTNDFTDSNAPENRRDRNLIVAAVSVKGPMVVAPPPRPDSHDRIITVRPGPGSAGPTWEQAATRVLEPLATRAFRRPVKPDELKGLVELTTLARDNNDTFEAGIQIALQAMLISPHFLFRVELDQYPDDPTIAHLISEYELATRLSYFLWSTMPDGELFDEAKAGTLRKNLDKQVRRMLAHDKAEALVENFASQWLQLRMLDSVNPDRRTFRDWEDSLRRSMRRETEEFFEYIIEEDLSVLTLLDADFTFVNEELAELYGMDVEGLSRREFRKVEYPDNNRGGILTHASVLTVTSNPTRTSAVKRGKYILENLLGEPPPPPPPEAGELPENVEKLEGTIREQFEQHRADPACANCHAKMDPLGFAFENFDGIGRWRTQERSGATIDASGVLEGREFSGPAELRQILLEMKDQFVRTMAEKMMTYALGRGLEYYDECAVQDITKAMAENHYRFSTLVMGIVKSEPFQMRRAKKPE